MHPDWGNADIWSPLASLLRDRFRVIRYDDRGFGRSSAPAAPFSRAGDRPGADHLLPLRVPGRLAQIIAEHAGEPSADVTG